LKLKVWNLYFVLKLYLFFSGQIELHWGSNLLLILILLIPIRTSWFNIARQILAVLAGVALLYAESHLPTLARAFSELHNIQQFTPEYAMELLARFVSLRGISLLATCVMVYLLIDRKIRTTTFVLLPYLVLPILSGFYMIGNAHPTHKARMFVQSGMREESLVSRLGLDEAASESGFDSVLAAFRKREADRLVSFHPEAGEGFDIIVLHICSLSWDDLDVAKMKNHQLLSRFDFLFRNFSSAASYSGPAAIRLLRANCGQQTHDALYKSVPSQCHLFAALAEAGFEPQVLMNHDGHFDNFAGQVRAELGVPSVNVMSTAGTQVAMHAFDNTPIADDFASLSGWLQQRNAHGSQPVALYYNTISLHDGNQLDNSKLTSLESYPLRVGTLFDDIDRFIAMIEQSGRKAVIVFVPEHGAALRGDGNQIAGMREIPTPNIVHIPVGVKLVGMPVTTGGAPQVIDAPSSYLALAQLVANLIADNPFKSGANHLERYVTELPQTEMVGENESTLMMRNGKGYVMKTPDGVWLAGLP
jgi:cellulose synthase operon protein YhjU